MILTRYILGYLNVLGRKDNPHLAVESSAEGFEKLPLWKLASDQAISDKLPQVTTEVTLSILLNVQLQRPSLEDNCTLLTSSLKWQSLLRWGTTSGILCLRTADKLPPELSIQSQSSQTPIASRDGWKLWPAIVRISCPRKGERSKEGASKTFVRCGFVYVSNQKEVCFCAHNHRTSCLPWLPLLLLSGLEQMKAGPFQPNEIEAKEACTWLRAAGFPQYAQLYEDSQFPIDISSVTRDHDFLDRDAIEALCRRLNTLNKCALMRLEISPQRKRISPSLSDDDWVGVVTPVWLAALRATGVIMEFPERPSGSAID
ncbi:hypothetical protein CCH79_00009305 [Gambusia affinis]|uniref:SAM domain-containing protein n=1 Tax=Gambusia affinis TaxID=33528 RepID=A0A315W4R4_GAMAF|nr:hypothetical protein CCH79_00009305 [Gambusia affinis]